MVVVVDDFPEARGVLVRILERGGLQVVEATSAVEAIGHLEKAPEGARVLVLVTSSIAATCAQSLLRHERKPKLLMTCIRPPSCPVQPYVQCADLGCVDKPGDFRDPAALIARVQGILAE